MKIKKYAALILLLIGFVAWTHPGRAAADDLGFEITSIRTSYLLAEPVFIDFKLKNKGSTGYVRVNSELDLEKENTSLFVAYGEGPFSQYKPGVVGEPSQLPVRLEPSESIVHRQLVIYELAKKEFAFPKAGTYRIKAVYHRFGTAPDVESNVIEIKVVEPTGTDANAFRLFNNKAVAELVMNANEDKEAVNNLELLMSKYGSSVYGKYAQFYLARRETQEFFERKPNYERAASLYRDLIRRDGIFPLFVEANYRLGISLIKTGNYEEARKKLNFVLKETNQTKIIKGAKKSLEVIERR